MGQLVDSLNNGYQLGLLRQLRGYLGGGVTTPIQTLIRVFNDVPASLSRLPIQVGELL